MAAVVVWAALVGLFVVVKLAGIDVTLCMFRNATGLPCPACGSTRAALAVADGRDSVADGYEEGYFFAPTLFDNVTTDMSIYTDEIFGPVLSTVRLEHFEEAIQLINENPYGNGTAVFTNDGGAARKFQNEIQVGMVGINVPIPVPLSFYSFGGWKDSIFGSHAIYGPEGVHFYTRQKVVISRWPDPIHRGVDLGFPTHG